MLGGHGDAQAFAGLTLMTSSLRAPVSFWHRSHDPSDNAELIREVQTPEPPTEYISQTHPHHLGGRSVPAPRERPLMPLMMADRSSRAARAFRVVRQAAYYLTSG
jgi:hypothetical protein